MAILRALTIAALIYCCSGVSAAKPKFRVVAFYTGKEDAAHISFLREAEHWFPAMAAKHHFSYDATSDWRKLNADYLAAYQVVVFLDTRPEDPAQRAAFQAYMEHGRVDGLSFRRFCFDAVSVSRKLGLVPQYIPRRRIVRQQHLETDIGRATRRGPHPSRDSASARDFSVLAE